MHNGQQVILVLDKKHMALLFISLFFIIIGSRAAVINYSGSFTPFLDEWDGDAAGLLKPYITADLTIRDLFSPFNEHIILFTRFGDFSYFRLLGCYFTDGRQRGPRCSDDRRNQLRAFTRSWRG